MGESLRGLLVPIDVFAEMDISRRWRWRLCRKAVSGERGVEDSAFSGGDGE
jgi:hypothetical protein